MGLSAYSEVGGTFSETSADSEPEEEERSTSGGKKGSESFDDEVESNGGRGAEAEALRGDRKDVAVF